MRTLKIDDPEKNSVKEQQSRGFFEDFCVFWKSNDNLSIALVFIRGLSKVGPLSEYPGGSGSMYEKFGCLQHVLNTSGSHSHVVKNGIYRAVLETFLELDSKWPDKKYTVYTSCRCKILTILSSSNFREYTIGLEGKIKKFMRSYLNAVKKKDMDGHDILHVLMNFRMYNEMETYGFTKTHHLAYLWDHAFWGSVGYKKESHDSKFNGGLAWNLFEVKDGERYLANFYDRKIGEAFIKMLFTPSEKVKNPRSLEFIRKVMINKGIIHNIFRLGDTDIKEFLEDKSFAD